MKELNFLKYATIIFMLFILFWVSFGGHILGTQGSKEDTKIVQKDNLIKEESKLKAELRDAEILGKFWNSKGHFIIVYNDTTKAPEVLEVEENEWGYMKVGELY